MTEEATALLKGPLYSAVWAGELPESQTPRQHEAYTAGGQAFEFKKLRNG